MEGLERAANVTCNVYFADIFIQLLFCLSWSARRVEVERERGGGGGGAGSGGGGIIMSMLLCLCFPESFLNKRSKKEIHKSKN